MNLFQEAKQVLDKDGKVNALGPYGKQKLTGREISAYFRQNPVKDQKLRNAVSVALDLGGAMSVASKEIKKFYGDKILKSKEVQTALKVANEETVSETNLQEISLDTNMLQRQFPNVWATKDSKLYRVLNALISFHGYNDNVKLYKKNPKAFIDTLKKIAKNPEKHKELGRDFKQYIEKPKKGQNFAEDGQGEGEIARRKRHIDNLKQKYWDADPVDRLDIKKKIKDLENKLHDRLRQLNAEVEEAVSPAQQAAIAISKKEKGEKPKNESVMNAYRQMWENSIEENMERSIMKKMRRGRVAKGMPR